MIEIEKNYKLTLTESQAKELYFMLKNAKDGSYLTANDELMLVLNELKKIFDSGIR
jgi:hypothetical protein